MNEKEFDFLGISKFHKSGYTGKNITIASKEAILNVFNDVECRDYFTMPSISAKHGTTVMDYIRQVLPDAKKIACSSTSKTVNNIWICPDFEKLLCKSEESVYLPPKATVLQSCPSSPGIIVETLWSKLFLTSFT